MKKSQKKATHLPWRTICLILLILIFFSFSIILTYDSGHYLSYVSIFEGNTPASSWDIVRGPIFPTIIRFSDVLFGKTSAGILICTLIFYLTFSAICYIISKEISEKYKHKKTIALCVTISLILNPLIFGYFHVLLTEFVAITMTMLNILVAYKWIFTKLTKKRTAVLYSLFFIFTTIFCWHLKQPYITIAVVPPLIASIFSCINNHSKANLLYRSSTIILSIICLVASIFIWDKILDLMQVDKETNRDSSSILSKQLLVTYRIENSDKTGVPALLDEFFQNPSKILGIYLNNYCSLTSVCKVTSSNGVDYISTPELDPINMYENSAIGYATLRKPENLFYMNEAMQTNAHNYQTPVGKNIFTPIMKVFIYPTNIIFKLSTMLCFPTLIYLIIIKIKSKDKKYNRLFCLNAMLLSTATLILTINAIALVIDRYAITAFVPACLGTFGAATYTIIISKQKRRKDEA